MSDPITLDHVRAVVADIVEAAGPDYAYVPPLGDDPGDDLGDVAGCFYAHAYGRRPGPGCLVGQTLVRLGVEESRLAEIDKSHFVPGAYHLTHRLISDGTLRLAPCVKCENGDNNHQCDTDAIVAFLQDIQMHQDGGQTWAEALRLVSGD